jgi:hypothetical protein
VAKARPGVGARGIVIAAFAVAMAYVEAAVVVYLQRALSIDPQGPFPLRDPASLGSFGAIEFGREAATLVMLGAVGWLGGRRGLERLAWAAVAFGVWDVFYYGWLWIFSGWPPSLGTWDLLFLIPVPWVGPVWAPLLVSAALIGFGSVAARRLDRGRPIPISRNQRAGVLAGGLLVVLSFTAESGQVLAGELPTSFPWPLFVAGMALAIAATASAIRATDRRRR